MKIAFLIIETLVFVVFALNILYVFFFSMASRMKPLKTEVLNDYFRKIAVLIPAYKEDGVILECVRAALAQKYPEERFDVVVISDKMQPSTNQELKSLPLILEIVNFENSTKAKALNLAMSHLTGYDVAVILDADNTIGPNFLKEINTAFASSSASVFQAHRTAKNKNTNLAFLDAVSEEINNNIFRQGHVNVGMSAALIGSGMAFNYELLKTELAKIPAVGGFDRALELALFLKKKKIGYLKNSDVEDEKIQNQSDFSRQRRRWMSAQVHYFRQHLKDVPRELFRGNWDFIDKMFQQMSIPRLLLLGLTAIISVALSFVSFEISLKWWIALVLLLTALLLAIPASYYCKQLIQSLAVLPLTFAGMFVNLFKLKGANKKFIHTKHGVS